MQRDPPARPPVETVHSVVVVGAGISGLAAAQKLLPTFPDLLVLEASERIGGRIKQVEGILPWPVELGPEFIHGAQTSLQTVLSDAGCTHTEKEWPDYWCFRSEGGLQPSSTEDSDVEAVLDLFSSIGKEQLPSEDMTAESWLRQKGANDRMLAIADACIANDFGCGLSDLGLREAILENRRWDSGDSYLVLDCSLSKLVQHMAKGLSRHICLSWPLSRVDHWDKTVKLTNSRGDVLLCERLVLTVPLTMLQQRSISFHPSLPDGKLGALSRVKMSTAVKVIVALSRQIWPDGFFDVICPGGFMPEFWVTRYPARDGYTGPELHGIIGFACGPKAVGMGEMRPSELIRATLTQLDEMFGSEDASKFDKFPATSSLVSAHIVDWSKEPYIKGAYSYPSLGAKIGDREAIAEAVGSTLFFAGEATHPAINPCIQAAYDTGTRAASQVLQARQQRVSKL